ncbi:Similar to phosphoglycolate phosphatase, clustered with ubiquinone biosynthesis SAM-dependent O-methyltransferase [hydrothermal vent metagenome]|uniref:Similar to phosphoglycolate phosphatase, clustered with ubiquinone biosynthesis SAM-dependent O-methyltransferase n=1 Tax=hydrothermal vent metagenome TaxID=652676 RepID=A0A3B0VGN1_9ZZZZ
MKGFLFDLDGTLVDTAIDMIAALKTLAAENGILINPDYNQYKELITHGSRAIVVSIFGHLDKNSIWLLQQRYLQIYQQNLTVGSCLFDGISAVITKLDNANIPWGIVTNKPAYLAQPLVDSLPQLHNCKVLIGGDCTLHSKPHPEPINRAIKSMPINPTESWYIGDALTDITAANAAGMNSAVALWGYLSNTDKPHNWHANKLLTNALDILEL